MSTSAPLIILASPRGVLMSCIVNAVVERSCNDALRVSGLHGLEVAHAVGARTSSQVPARQVDCTRASA